MYNIRRNIQLPKKNITTDKNKKNEEQNEKINNYNIEPGINIFDPNDISSSPPNYFLKDLEFRMNKYYESSIISSQ